MIEVQLPSGAVIQVDAPDPQSAAAAARAYMQKNGLQVPPPPAGVPAVPQAQSNQPPAAMSPDAPFADDSPTTSNVNLGDELMQAPRGFNKAIEPLVVAPSSLVNMARNIPGAIRGDPYQPNPFQQWYEDNFTKGPEAQTGIGSGLEKAGEFIGSGAPFTAGAGAMANAGVRAAAPVTRGIGDAVKGAFNSIMENFAQKPAAAAATDVALNALSGAGAEAGKETIGGPMGEMAGAIGAPMAAAVPNIALNYTLTGNAAKLAGKFGMKVASKIIPEPSEEQGFIKNKVATWAKNKRESDAISSVQGDLAPVWNDEGVQAEMKRVKALQEDIPGFNPTVAKQSNDPALLAQQQVLEQGARGGELRQMQERRDQSAQAIRDFADNVAPAPSGAQYPEDIVGKAVKDRVEGVDAKLAAQQEATKGKIQGVSDTLPEIDRAAAGDQLRTIRNESRTASNEEVDRLRAAIDPEGSVRVPTDDLHSVLNAELKNLGTDLTSPTTPKSVRELIENTKPLPDPKDPEGKRTIPQDTDINSLLEKRTQLLQEQRRLASAGNLTPDQIGQRDVLDAAIRRTNKFLDEVALPDKDAQARFEQFRKYYREEYVPRYSEGASREIGRYDQNGYGKQRVANEDVPGEFFAPNNISGAKQFSKLYGNDPDARATMTDYALDAIRQKHIDPQTGLLRKGGIDTWLNQNSRVLNEMPWIRDAVQSKNPADLYARIGELEARKQRSDKFVLNKVLGKEPGAAIDAALGDWRVARGLKASVRDNPEAEKALTRAVWERTLGKGEIAGDALYDGDKIAQVLNDKGTRRALTEILSPDHLKHLDTIAQAAQVEGRIPSPRGSAELPKTAAGKIEEVLGVGIPQMLSRVFAVQSGRTSARYVGMELAGRIANNFTKREMRAAWKEALYNPGVAETLASAIRNGKATPMQTERLRSYLAIAPIDARNAPPKQHQDDQD